MATKDEEARKRQQVATRMTEISKELRMLGKQASKVAKLSAKLSKEHCGLDTYHIADGTRFSRWATVVDCVSRDPYELKDLTKVPTVPGSAAVIAAELRLVF
jgi:hypothetical protein